MQSVLWFRKTTYVSGHFFKTVSTVSWMWRIWMFIALKIPDCEKSLFALAQIRRIKKARGMACFGGINQSDYSFNSSAILTTLCGFRITTRSRPASTSPCLSQSDRMRLTV